MDYNAHTVFYMGYLDDDPRIIFLVEQEFALFHTVSLNTFCKICVLPHWRARGKPSYPISILICADLATGSVAFINMDDAKMGAIEEALDMLRLKFRMPEYVITDAATQFTGLQENADQQKTFSSCDIQVTVVPHQFQPETEA